MISIGLDDFTIKKVSYLESESALRIKRLNNLIKQETELFELEKKEKHLKIKLVEKQIEKMEYDMNKIN